WRRTAAIAVRVAPSHRRLETANVAAVPAASAPAQAATRCECGAISPHGVDVARSKRAGPGFRDRLVLLAGTATHADGADHPAVLLERDSARKDHDPAVIRPVDPVELRTRLALRGQLLRRDIECPRRERLVDRNIDAPNPCAIHADVGDEGPP